jgi:hypothetical protein
VLAGFVLARAAAGLLDRTVSLDVTHREQIRAWFRRPLWEMQPADADAYFGKVLRAAAKGTRLSRARSLKTYFMFLELRYKAAIYQLTGRVAECPADEMNRPAAGRRRRCCGSRLAQSRRQHRAFGAAVAFGPPVVFGHLAGRAGSKIVTFIDDVSATTGREVITTSGGGRATFLLIAGVGYLRGNGRPWRTTTTLPRGPPPS